MQVNQTKRTKLVRERANVTRNRMVGCVAATVILAATAASMPAAEAKVGADIASAYVFRGATFNDGPVFQPYMEVGGLPVSFGVWGNLDIDDYDGALREHEFSEVDLYASYALPLGIEPVETTLGYVEYLYPGADAAADRELSLAFACSRPLNPSLGLYYGIDGGIDKSLHVELGLGHSIKLGETSSLDLGANVAYESPDEGEEGFSYFTLSAGLNVSIFSAGVTYVGQIDDDVLVDAEDGGAYDVELYGAVGVSAAF